MLNDANKNLTIIPIDADLVDGDSCLIIGMYVKKYAITTYMKKRKEIMIWRPSDIGIQKVFTYVISQIDRNERLRMYLAARSMSTCDSAMADITKRNEINIATKVHIHMQTFSDVKNLFQQAEISY